MYTTVSDLDDSLCCLPWAAWSKGVSSGPWNNKSIVNHSVHLREVPVSKCQEHNKSHLLRAGEEVARSTNIATFVSGLSEPCTSESLIDKFKSFESLTSAGSKTEVIPIKYYMSISGKIDLLQSHLNPS